jgi:hypothetical protein
MSPRNIAAAATSRTPAVRRQPWRSFDLRTIAPIFWCLPTRSSFLPRWTPGRTRRNQSGGYWIAKDDPRAATEAVTGSVPLARLGGAAVLSNGASRMVDPYRLCEWPAALELLRTSGPDDFLRRIRNAETEAGAAGSLPGFEFSDDATVAYCALPH